MPGPIFLPKNLNPGNGGGVAIDQNNKAKEVLFAAIGLPNEGYNPSTTRAQIVAQINSLQFTVDDDVQPIIRTAEFDLINGKTERVVCQYLFTPGKGSYGLGETLVKNDDLIQIDTRIVSEYYDADADFFDLGEIGETPIYQVINDNDLEFATQIQKTNYFRALRDGVQHTYLYSNRIQRINISGPHTLMESDFELLFVDGKTVKPTDIPTALSELTDDIGAVDPTPAFSAYLNLTTGDDTTATIENARKPFKTMGALIMALPEYDGTSFRIFINGSNLYNDIQMPVMPVRNLIFEANANEKYNFVFETNERGGFVLEDTGGSANYLFENNNISLVSNSASMNSFASNGSGSPITLLGTIDKLDWSSPPTSGGSRFKLTNIENFTINEIVNHPDYEVLTLPPFPNKTMRVKKLNYNGYFNNPISASSTNSEDSFLIIDEIYNSSSGTVSFGVFKSTVITIKRIDIKGSFQMFKEIRKVIFDDLKVGADTIDIQPRSVVVISGNTPVTLPVLLPRDSSKVLQDFQGHIAPADTYWDSDTVFDSCFLTINGYMFKNQVAGRISPLAIFKGFNVINQLDETKAVFDIAGDGKEAFIEVQGTVKTNAVSYGKGVSVLNTFSTTKEKLNEIVIKSKLDLLGRELDVSLTYIIDGTILLEAGEYIEVPAGGNLTINGYGLEASKIRKDVVGESIFKSPAGGSGGLQMQGLSIGSGAGDVFDITDATGDNAIEVNVVNFEGCASLGTIEGYRQFLGTTIGIYGCQDGLTLDGSWNGFKITNTNCFGFGASGTIFKKGASLIFNSRFYAELNIDLPTGTSSIFDFESTNFSDDELLQLRSSQITRNHVINVNDPAYFPNIDVNDNACLWLNNTGAPNTALDFQDFKSPDGTIYRLTAPNGGGSPLLTQV